MKSALASIALLSVAAACSDAQTPKSDEQYRQEIASGMKDALRFDAKRLVRAAQAIVDAAPAPQGRGWDPALDADAINAMKADWAIARDAYEHIEGAVALKYPDLDFAIDSRYEDQVAASGGDSYLFDDQGVVGFDAIERVLWADRIPSTVSAYESMLSGYVAARFPISEQEASDFKYKLSTKLVADATKLLDSLDASSLDIDHAFSGLIALVEEQREELDRAPTDAEESRYSQRTMGDLRANIEAVGSIYGLFRPWVQSKPTGSDVDGNVEVGIQRVSALYSAVSGEAVPPVPATWNAKSPSPQDLASPYGTLYEGIVASVDPSTSGTLSTELSRVAALVGITITH